MQPFFALPTSTTKGTSPFMGARDGPSRLANYSPRGSKLATFFSSLPGVVLASPSVVLHSSMEATV